MIRDDYGIRLRNERNAHITSLIDRLQFYEECCGSQNASNWNGSRWQTTVGTSSSSIEGDLQLYSLFNSVPATCCVQLTGATPVNPVARSFARCQQPEASKIWRHQSGCHEKLLQWLDVQTTIFASVGFSFAIFQMIGVCTALSLFRHAHGYHYVRA
uniref:Tetraspanin-17 n=1 Tax=Ascaris suum TaxID=6253 RepID=F1LFJ6_ASCSU